MGKNRTAWHVLLAALLEQRGPRSFEYRSEVPLSSEPLRGDLLLLRREPAPALERDVPTLRRLWDLLPKETILEFKSVGRPYRSRGLHRLSSYLYLYYADQPARLMREADLGGVLLVPARTPSLYADAVSLGLWWRDLGGGYARLERGAFALYVVEIDVAADADDDDLLRLFGHGEPHTTEARRWLSRQIGSQKAGMTMEQLEEFEDIAEKFLAKLQPETVRKLLPKLLLTLPVEVLQGLSDTYLATLPEPTRAAIRARIAR